MSAPIFSYEKEQELFIRARKFLKETRIKRATGITVTVQVRVREPGEGEDTQPSPSHR